MQIPPYLKTTSLAIAGIAIIIGTFILGISYNDLPEFTAKKYLMPAVYRVNLRATNYKIWYFRNKTRCNEELNKTKPLESPEVELPELSIKDVRGNSIKWKVNAKDIAGHSISRAVPIGDVEIKNSGVYLLNSSFGSKEKFAIALVSPTAKRRDGTIFGGFFDEPMNPVR